MVTWIHPTSAAGDSFPVSKITISVPRPPPPPHCCSSFQKTPSRAHSSPQTRPQWCCDPSHILGSQGNLSPTWMPGHWEVTWYTLIDIFDCPQRVRCSEFPRFTQKYFEEKRKDWLMLRKQVMARSENINNNKHSETAHCWGLVRVCTARPIKIKIQNLII